jgi:diadenosine tetraphosphate (Ap4A) HIT family hydrolase
MTSPACVLCSPHTDLLLLESDEAVAVLDPSPLAPGHSLIVSRAHAESWAALPSSSKQAVWDLANATIELLSPRLTASGWTLIQNDGSAAELSHPHVHIIPRWEKDGLAMWPTALAPHDELVALHSQLKDEDAPEEYDLAKHSNEKGADG